MVQLHVNTGHAVADINVKIYTCALLKLMLSASFVAVSILMSLRRP